jgi:hypothetical protein
MNKIVTEAISVLKLYRNDWSLGSQNNERLNKAIDTVVKELEKPLPTDEQIEQYALKNILDGVGIQSMKNTKAWIAGVRWMRGLIQERSKK